MDNTGISGSSSAVGAAAVLPVTSLTSVSTGIVDDSGLIPAVNIGINCGANRPVGESAQ